MNNMESLYNEFEQYFKDNQEKINYFLDVMKNVKEDMWEYKEKYRDDYYQKTIIYDTISIVFNNHKQAGKRIYIVANHNIIYFDYVIDDLPIKLVAFIERVEKMIKEK